MLRKARVLGAVTILASIVAVGVVRADDSARGEAGPGRAAIQERRASSPCPEAVSTLDLEHCLKQRLQATDRRIEALNEALAADLGNARLKRRLLAGHRAWLAYRDTDCESLWAVGEEGTIYPVLVGNCELDRNRQRIGELRAALAWPEKP